MNDYLKMAAGYADLDKTSEAIKPLIEIEREYIEHILALCAGNVQKTAKYLQISPSTLYRKRMRWQSADFSKSR